MRDEYARRVQGRTVDFKNTLIIMTSNVGSSVIEKGGGGLGFQLDNSEEDSSYNRIKVRLVVQRPACRLFCKHHLSLTRVMGSH